MKWSQILAFSLLSIAAVPGFSQATLVEEVKPSETGTTLVIPYKKYTLPNGLTVILHEDHSDPIVHVDVTYHVGSARELVGRSGFAHFFEHMMFQGSDNVGDEQHFKIVSEAGGTLNGTTNQDRTNYFETMPSNQLEVALWLESDRMGYFLDAVTQEKFEVQRATVKNERGQNYDNRPYGLATEKIGEALYPFGHPYSWTTIGYIDDLNAATLDDLKKFFLRWYGPNNATLTIAGDFTSTEAIQLVEKYFGSIPQCPKVENMAAQPPVLDKNRYISYEDKIRFPNIRITWPSVEARHPDEAPLDILANILGGGNNSILFQRLVKTQKVLQASAYNPASELAGMFQINAFGLQGANLADLEKEIRNALLEFEQTGVSDQDLARFLGEHEAGEINGLQSVSGKASKLAYYQTFAGTANYLNEDLERYKRVTKEDVMRVYNTYIKDKFAVILSVVPIGSSDLIAAADNYQRPVAPDGYKNNLSEYEGLTYTKGKSTFDRSKQPVPGVAPLVKVPEYWTQDYENGVRVIGTINNELPTMGVRISLKAGQIRETYDNAGIASMMAEMLNESTTNSTAEEIALKLELLGSFIRIYSSREDILIDVSCLSKNFAATMDILEEKLFNPKFDTAEFARIKLQTLESIANQKNSASTIASNIMHKLLYPTGDVYGLPEIGLESSVETLTAADLKAYYEKWWSSNLVNVVVVGSLKKAEVTPEMSFLKSWKNLNALPPAVHNTNKPDNLRIYFVNKEGAAQSEIRVFGPGPMFDAYGDYFKSNVMNYVLGGAFNSHLNLNLRENKGYTYGVRSAFIGSAFSGFFSVGGGFLKQATDTAVVEIIRELRDYRDNGISEEELLFTKNSIGQRDALKYETLFQKAGFLQLILEYKLDKTYVSKQLEALRNLNIYQVNQLARSKIPVEKSWVVVVGDKATVYENLKKTGFEVIEMDVNGNVISD